MLIKRGDVIAGQPAVEVRTQLRGMGVYPYLDDAEALAVKWGMSPDDAVATLARFGSAGLVMAVNLRGQPLGDGQTERCCWGITDAGIRLAKARIGKELPRKKAEGALEALVARAREANAGDYWTYWVVAVDLFGSLADPSSETVGDIDVGVLFRPKWGGEEQEQRDDEFLDRATVDRGVERPHGTLEQMFFAENALRRHIRGRSPVIDLTGRIPSGATRVPAYRFERADPRILERWDRLGDCSFEPAPASTPGRPGDEALSYVAESVDIPGCLP